MKRLTAAILGASALAIAATAALDFSAARAIPVISSAASIDAGATNLAAVSASGLKGNAALFVTVNGSDSRTALDLTLWATNAAEGGWTLAASASYTSATNAGVYRLDFPGEYLTSPARVGICPKGAGASATAFILTH